jgi:hypothetical protein
MSTPISTLPLKTQPSAEANDINDPVVQDVLNEFQDELMMSKKSAMPQHPQMPPMPPHQPYPPQQHSSHSQQYPQSMYPHPSMYPTPNGNGKYDSISAYVDTEVAKKSLILVILAVIIYHSGIINTVYEKMPDNLQDHLTNFDIYIKSISLFSIIYVLSFFEYI